MGAAVAVAALVVGLVVVTGGQDDTDGASGNRPVATETTDTDPRTTDSDDTVAPDTIAPNSAATTVP